MNVIWQPIAAIAAAAIVAAALTGFPPGANEATANVSIQAVSAQTAPAPGCEQRGWPYTQTCGQQAVRIITTDKLK